MDSVVVKNLVKNYGDVKAVKNISFSIKKGEIFGILGPNGAGKTTTINCITQLSTKTSGKITVNGFDVNKEYIEAKTQIGLSPQDIKFDIYFSVLNILVYQGGYYGMPKKKAKERAITLLKDFNLYEKRNLSVRQLSGGMKRKFSIIRALMHNPSILILDEPTAALDVDSRYELWDFVKKLNKSGITIILTTHYIEEAEKLCNRICIVSKGKILKLDRTEKMLEELSRNKIIFYLEQDYALPRDIEKFDYVYKDKKLEVLTNQKDQHKVLNSLIKLMDDNNFKILNFKVDQDKLENIFRRIVNEN